MGKRKNFKGLSFPEEFIEQVIFYMEENPELGYTSPSDVLKDCFRDRLSLNQIKKNGGSQ